MDHNLFDLPDPHLAHHQMDHNLFDLPDPHLVHHHMDRNLLDLLHTHPVHHTDFGVPHLDLFIELFIVISLIIIFHFQKYISLVLKVIL